MKHVLVSGASGFLGKQVVRLLGQNKNLFLHTLVRNRQHSSIPLSQKRTACHECDITDSGSVRAAHASIGHIDAIIHMAAYVQRTKDEDILSEMVATNVLGTTRLLDEFGHGIKRL